jgi:hypothetical protein
MIARILLAFVASLAMAGNPVGPPASPADERLSTQVEPVPLKCPNLSGQYVFNHEAGQIRIDIEQPACERIHISRSIQVEMVDHVLTLDGKARKESEWFGALEDGCCDTSAAFVGPTLKIEQRSSGGVTSTVTYSLTSEGDLVEEAVFLDGQRARPLLFKRQN